MRRLLRGLVAALLILLAAPAFAEEACPGSRAPSIPLPHTKAAVLANQEVTVIALGSSSTAGWHSSDIGHSYPAVLQSTLGAAIPHSHIAVLNRGVGGQDAAEMAARLDADVLAAHPDLVIWQAGANGAMKRMSPEQFRAIMRDGVQRLLDAKIDVVLMDNQRAPQILASPQHALFDQALADVANATGTGLFARGALMEQWRLAGYPYHRFMSDDGVHHNDYGYRCVALALTRSLLDGLGLPHSSDAMASIQKR